MSSKLPQLQISENSSKIKIMKITVIGVGYVGLVTGACLAELGHHVVCYDSDETKTNLINAGLIQIKEVGLDAMVARNIADRTLNFTSELEDALDHGMLQIIAVGTPGNPDGTADLQHVYAVAKNIGQHMDSQKVIVVKSTVPVGTCEKVKAIVQEQLDKRGIDVEFSVVSNPEFLREGLAIEDFMRPDRIIVGTEDSDSGNWARDKILKMYRPLAPLTEIICMDLRSSELTKYAANAMLAARISFMNEMAALSEACGADIGKVRIGIGSDRRIGKQFLRAGIGYGGSCFPKDVNALHAMQTSYGLAGRMTAATVVSNLAALQSMWEKIQKRFPDLTDKIVAVWGLAFKPGTNDVRESQALRLVEKLLEHGATVLITDPVVRYNDVVKELRIELTDEMKKRLSFVTRARDTLSSADAVVLATEWEQYGQLGTGLFTKMRTRVVFDGRNILNSRLLSEEKVEYHSVGRAVCLPKEPK